MHYKDPLRPESPRVDLFVTLAASPAGPWLPAADAGATIPEPASSVDVHTCTELRCAITALGTAVSPAAAAAGVSAFRVTARGPDHLRVYLLGMGSWVAKGGVFMSVGAPWIRCDRLDVPWHICPKYVLA